MAEIATEIGCTPAQVLLRWGVQHGVAPIPKSLRPERIAQSTHVFDEAIRLSDEQMGRLNSLRDPRRGTIASIEAHTRIIASADYRWQPT